MSFRKLCLLVLLFTMGSAMSVWAEDLKNAQDYFKVKDVAMTYDRPYIEFEFAEHQTSGNDDAFKNSHFYVKIDGREYELAAMKKEHTGMTDKNTNYGVIGFYGVSKDTNPRIAYMRYYPSESAIGKIQSFRLKGKWDIDDNDSDKGGKDYYVDKTIKVSKCNSFDFKGMDNMEFTYKRIGSDRIQGTVKLPYTPSRELIYDYGIVVHENDGHAYRWSMMSNDQTYKTLNSGYSLRETSTIYIQAYSENKANVNDENGKLRYGSDGYHLEVYQKFYSNTKKSVRVTPLPAPSNLIATRDPNSFKVTLNWNYSNSGYEQGYKIRVFRRKASEDIDKRVEIGSTDQTNTRITEPSKVDDPQSEYIYEVTSTPSNWSNIENDITCSVKLGSCVNGMWSGQGTGADPYKISNVNDLRKLANFVNIGYDTRNFNWLQTADLDLGGKSSPWVPIGHDNNFAGYYNGDCHKITNMYVDGSKYTNSGLFGKVVLPVAGVPRFALENLYLLNSRVDGGKAHTGLLFGEIQEATVAHCYVEGVVNAPNSDFVGGILGYADGVRLSGVSFVGEVKGRNYVGGLCGVSYSSFSMYNTYSAAAVSGGNSYVGLYAGHLTNGYKDSFSSMCVDNSRSKNLKEVGAQNSSTGKDVDYIATVADGKGVGMYDHLRTTYWNYVAGKYPVYRDLDKDNLYEITAISGIDMDIPKDKDIRNVSFKYQYNMDGKYTTMILPCGLSQSDIMLTGGKFYKYHGRYAENGTYLVFMMEVQSVEANTPYLFESATQTYASGSREICLNSVGLVPTVDVSNAAVAPKNMGLVGSFRNVEIPDGGYVFQNSTLPIQGVVASFREASIQEKSNATKAYLWMPDLPADASEVGIMLFDGTSGVPEMNAENIEKAKGIFNMNGQKLSAPQDGVNIINGVKVMKWK